MPASNKEIFDPVKILKDPEFKVLTDEEAKSLPKDVNIACAYNDKQEIHMVRKPMPKALEGQCVVKIKATGICGSDVHFWKHGGIGETMKVTDECGAGHESAGEIIEVGPGVTGWKVGDRAAIEAGIPCGQCDECKRGRYNACPDVVFFSTPPYHGVLTRFHAHPAAWLHKIPDSMSFEEAALCEPLAVALAGIERAGVKLGDPVLITGCGPIGLVTLLACRAAGCHPIVITDLAQSRLDFAKKLVPSVETILIDRDMKPRDQAQKIKEAAGVPLHVAMDCTGVESSIQTAIYSMRSAGMVFIIGVGKSDITLPFGHLADNEIDVRWLFRYANQYPKAIRLVSSGLIDVKPLVTHRFDITEATKAFYTAADIKSGSIKCQVLQD